MNSSSGLYNDFYAECNNPYLYASPWWLDAVCGPAKWDAVAISDEEGKIITLIPFYKTRISSLSALITPPLTQWIPVLTKEPEGDFSINNFLASFPKCSIIDVTMKSALHNILPSSGYRINYKYSYVIPYDASKETFRLHYNEGLRRNLKEAEKKYTIASTDDVHTFLQLCKSSYRIRKLNPPSWLDQVLPSAVDALHEHSSGVIHFVFHQGAVLAGILTGWDFRTTYYLAGGRNGDEDGASAHALLLDYVIQNAQERGQSFDFEGSMHPGIANFFQSFGAVPESYLQIRKFRGAGKLWSVFH